MSRRKQKILKSIYTKYDPKPDSVFVETKFDGLVRTGAVESFAEIASLGHVTRARVSQIINLLNLAPDIQEAILFLPPVTEGRDPVILADLQPIAMTADWRKQRKMWAQLVY